MPPRVPIRGRRWSRDYLKACSPQWVRSNRCVHAENVEFAETAHSADIVVISDGEDEDILFAGPYHKPVVTTSHRVSVTSLRHSDGAVQILMKAGLYRYSWTRRLNYQKREGCLIQATYFVLIQANSWRRPHSYRGDPEPLLLSY